MPNINRTFQKFSLLLLSVLSVFNLFFSGVFGLFSYLHVCFDMGGRKQAEIAWYIMFYKMTALARGKKKCLLNSSSTSFSSHFCYSPGLLTNNF